MEIKQEEILGDNPRIKILGSLVDVLGFHDTISLVERYVIEKKPLHLMGVNADKINSMRKNALLRRIVNSCGIINADGASVVMASRLLGHPLPERVAGIDLMTSLIKLSALKGYTVYLLGAKQEIVNKTASVLKEKNPLLNIVGIHNGYFDKSQWKDIARELLRVKPDFVFVGITSPTKEYLIEFLQNEGIHSVFMGVGGSFDVVSGKLRRAPKWMQKTGLEWLYRVMQEPGRLFKRYFVGNLIFFISVIREKFGNGFD